jgi:hypothetical protein
MPEKPSPQPAPSLLACAEIIPENFRALMNALEPVSRTAQAVHEGFLTLIHGGVEVSTEGQMAANVMCIYGHFGWTEAMVLTGAANQPLGLAAARRSVEFCCYAAKVVKNNKRARDWIMLDEDKAAGVRFHKACQIPVAYDSKDYRFLWPLIAHYDLASEYGVHANFTSLASMAGGFTENKGLFNQQSDRPQTISNTITMIVLGYRLYNAMLRILDPCVKDKKKQEQTWEYAREEVKKLRLEYARDVYKGRVPEQVVYGILTDRVTGWEQRFKEYVERSRPKPRKCPKCEHVF